MKKGFWWVVLAGMVIANPLFGQKAVKTDVTGEYDWVSGWLKPVQEGWEINPVTVFAQSEDRIFIGLNGAHPAPPPGREARLKWAVENQMKWAGGMKGFEPGVDYSVYVVDRNGKTIEKWSQWADLFKSLHRIRISPYDPQKHVWIIDRNVHQVMEFTNDGKELLRTWGTKGEAGDDEKHFDRPADIAWLPDGTFFVVQGYGASNRVMKFDKDGKYLMSFGRTGKIPQAGPGEFNMSEAIAVDAKRRVWVTDRKNRRIQIFDENGKFLDMWTGFEEPQLVLITPPPNQYVWVLDSALARFLKYDMNGKLITYWGTEHDPDRFTLGASTFLGREVPGGLAWPHDFSVDPQGNLYVMSGKHWTIDKYVPKKDADKSRLLTPWPPYK